MYFDVILGSALALLVMFSIFLKWQTSDCLRRRTAYCFKKISRKTHGYAKKKQ